ncbi:MAG: hypothetical protein V4683_16005 [Bacteroidota bacterium]
MALKTTVKVSGVNNLSNARYCAGMGVDLLGFDMDTLPLEQFNEIKNWVAGVKIVGETNADSIEVLIEKLNQYKPDLVELNSKSLAEALLTLNNIPVILKYASESSIVDLPKNVKYVLSNNSLTDLEVFKNLDKSIPTLLISDELYDKNLVDSTAKNIGIFLIADQEERPGYSNFENIMEILESLEIDD